MAVEDLYEALLDIDGDATSDRASLILIQLLDCAEDMVLGESAYSTTQVLVLLLCFNEACNLFGFTAKNNPGLVDRYRFISAALGDWMKLQERNSVGDAQRWWAKLHAILGQIATWDCA